MVRASAELQERDALKRLGFATAMTDTLHSRGISDPTANLAAELGVLAFRQAYAQWAEAADQQSLGERAQLALRELHAASLALR